LTTLQDYPLAINLLEHVLFGQGFLFYEKYNLWITQGCDVAMTKIAAIFLNVAVRTWRIFNFF
jgi:hypothetical protein